MKVVKFGGSSVQTAERIRNVVQIVKNDKSIRAVVCSAFGGITDKLINTAKQAANADEIYQTSFREIEKAHLDAARELVDVKRQSGVLAQIKNTLNELEDVLQGIFLLRELSVRTLDFVSSFGERLSCYIISEAFKDYGFNSAYLDARKVVVTDDNFGSAEVIFEITYAKMKEYFAQNPALQIVTGFIGATQNGVTTTLGRGGSDYSASLFGAGLDAEVVEIWTDVDGVMTADPRKVSKAFSIPFLTYEEAMEMSHFGAKVIYPPTMLPAMRKNIPISIRNTFNPSFVGSFVQKDIPPSTKPVKGITSISHIALLRVQGGGMVGVVGVAGRLFSSLAQARINVILITQASSEHSISFAVKPDDAQKAKEKIEAEFAKEIREGFVDEVFVEMNLSIVAVVGENMRRASGVAGSIFSALGKNGINIVAIAQGSSELNISTVIRQEDEVKALRSLHQTFFLSEPKTLNLFVAGVGLIGGTLLKQLEEQTEYLLENYHLELKIVALANSKKHLFHKEGIDLKNWRETLEKEGKTGRIDSFVSEMFAYNFTNSIFIDNSASAEVAAFYQRILEHSISIVTPNKIASSSSYAQYLTLKKTAKSHNVNYLYETNVGAALPVISTLKDLVDSGDRIKNIEAVLSGTLSYIFNTFDGSSPFSSVVKKAKELGYTEPDPRQDLNGSDVARKILILAREAGYRMEFEDVEIQGFIPENCMQAESVEAFFVELEKADSHFEILAKKAQNESQKFRYIAKFENGKAVLSLQSVGQNHPFYSLSGSDNIIAFTTSRYPERPLVVKGSGAGAEVTAAGVFSDIIRIGNYL